MIAGFLDYLITIAKEITTSQSKYQLADFVYYLIRRSVESNSVTVEKLWFWLDQFGDICRSSNQHSKQVADTIRENKELTLNLQYFVLFEFYNSYSFNKRVYLLRYRLVGLSPTSEDVIELLKRFDPTDRDDLRWKSLLHITPQNEDFSIKARASAKRFAAHRPDLLKWIDQLAVPQIPKWKTIKEVKRERREKAKRAVAFAEDRKYYKLHIMQVQKGVHDLILYPAKAYLNFFRDLDKDALPHLRVSQWLGNDLAKAACEGFDVVLQEMSPIPSAYDIAKAFAEKKEYESGLIIVAALTQRLRKNISFSDLTDERLMAGLFVLLHCSIPERAHIDDLQETIEFTLKERGVWKETIRLYIEPQLEAGLEDVRGLSIFARDSTYYGILASLANEWLERFLNMPSRPESELIDVLLKSGKYSELREISSNRNFINDDVRRRNWESVDLIVNFETTAKKFETVSLERELLWPILDKTSDRHGVNSSVSLGIFQIEWLIKKFRSLWPVVGSPKDGRIRSMHTAQQYIIQLITHLGNDSRENARAALIRLKDATADGYTPSIKSVFAEQTQKMVESTYTPPSLSAIWAITQDTAPEYITDLQAIVLEELHEVQAKIKSDDAESWRGFYDDQNVPYDEERCRDHLLGLLRQGSKDLKFDPETHVAADKEVDITCSIGELRLPIEIKGQWHKALWKGADGQLDKQYTPDWRAHGHGIYLVFWFGQQDKVNVTIHGVAFKP